MIKRILVFGFITFLSFLVHAADQYVFEQSSSASVNSSILDKQITVNKTFANINAVVVKLNTLGLSATTKNKNEEEIKNVLINTNGTINDFINQAALNFNYAVSVSGNNIVFQAKDPQKIKQNDAVIAKVKPVTTQETWTLTPKDKTLRNALTKWAKTAGWQLIWNVKADYPITTVWAIPGTFESAINEVLRASQTTDIPLIATMHDNNHVLEIFSTTASK